jgi:hypothetical protein
VTPLRVGGVAFGLVGAMVVTLRAMGRVWWCKCAAWSPVSWTVASSHNSQHLLDAYSFSHFQHGLLFLPGLLWLGRGRLPVAGAVLGSVALEALWEVVENTPLIIDRYRAATISLDYSGDSVANSLSDVACCTLGALFAARAPWWVTAVVFLVIEGGMLASIRDSLLLNVWMLAAPSDLIRTWQAGG